MDQFSPVAPAQIRVLVLPFGHIERTTFSGILERLQKDASKIPLADVAQYVSNDDLLLSPKAFPRGMLLYNYNTSTPSEQQLQLSPFELFREPTLVLGIANSLSAGEDYTQKELASASEYLRERHPRVVHRQLMILVEELRSDGHTEGNVVYVTTAAGSEDSSLQKAMCQVSAKFLGELSTYTAAMRASPNVQTPGQTTRKFQNTLSLNEHKGRPASSYGALSSQTAPTTPTEENGPRLPTSDISSPPTRPVHTPTGSNDISRSDSQSSASSSKHARASSQDRISLQGFGSSTSHEKLRHRGKSRVGIVIGSLYMMAGQWSDALRILVEHTTKARTLADNIWHGKGMEYIIVCLLLHTWVGLEFQMPSICYHIADKNSASQQRFSVNVPSDFRPTDFAQQSTRFSSYIPDLLRLTLNLYRAGEGPLELPALVISEASVRFCKLLAFVNLSNGDIESIAFKSLLSGLGSEAAIGRAASGSENKIVTKTAIAEILSRGVDIHDDDFPVGDRIRILAAASTIYGMLHMKRKKATIMHEMIIKLTDALTQARKKGAAEMGIHPAASLSADTGSAATLDIIRESAGLHEMIQEIADIYAIPLQNLANPELTQILSVSGNLNLKTAIAKDLIALCEASPDPAGVLRLVIFLLASATSSGMVDKQIGPFRTILGPDEQSRLATTIGRAIGVGNYLGFPDMEAVYWDPFLLRGVNFRTQSALEAIFARQKPVGAATEHKTGSENPFLHERNANRPRTAIADVNEQYLVQGEAVECVLTLQNPSDLQLTVERLELVAEGVDIRSTPHSFELPPTCLQKVVLLVTARSPGHVKIKGCRLKIRSCAERFFPIVSSPLAPSLPLLVKDICQNSMTMSSAPGIDQSQQEPKYGTVSATVIPSQPLLEIEATSLAESSLMLLDGERRKFTITLRNKRTIPASIYRVSTTDAALQFRPRRRTSLRRLGEPKSGELSEPQEHIVIGENETSVIDFEITGKLGLPEVLITFCYGADTEAAQYVRRLTVPIKLTVHSAFSAQNLDILPLTEEHSSRSEANVSISLDVRSTWPKPVTYHCFVGVSTESKIGITENEISLSPGEVKRIRLTTSPSALGINYDDDTEVVRKKLLGNLHLTWNTEGRSGEVDVSSLLLSSDAIDLLRGCPIQMKLCLVDTETNMVNVRNFVTIRVCIHLTSGVSSSGPLYLQIHARPLYAPDSRYEGEWITVAGATQKLLPAVSTDKETNLDFAACPLLSGEVEVVATARPLQISAESVSPIWQASASMLLHIV